MERHHIIVRDFSELRSRPGFKGMRGIARPVSRFEVEVAAKEGMELGLWMVHFFSCWGSGVVPFVVFAGFWEGGEVGLDIWLLGGSRRGGGNGVEGESGRAFEGVRHYYYSVLISSVKLPSCKSE